MKIRNLAIAELNSSSPAELIKIYDFTKTLKLARPTKPTTINRTISKEPYQKIREALAGVNLSLSDLVSEEREDRI